MANEGFNALEKLSQESVDTIIELADKFGIGEDDLICVCLDTLVREFHKHPTVSLLLVKNELKKRGLI